VRTAGAFKKFATAVFKIAVGLALAVVLLALLAWGVVNFRQYSQDAANAPLVKVKTWPEQTGISGSKFSLQTVWRNGRIYYRLVVSGYPPSFQRARDSGNGAVFIISFLDKDGFQLFQRQVNISEMTEAVDTLGKPGGLSWKGDETTDSDLYRRAAALEVSWAGFPSADAMPAQVPTSLPPDHKGSAPAWRNVARWRSLRQGMSQEEVKQRLGAPGKIDNMGFSVMWWYGYPMGGSVTFDSNGAVTSWSEP
jgi:hypothetical protein